MYVFKSSSVRTCAAALHVRKPYYRARAHSPLTVTRALAAPSIVAEGIQPQHWLIYLNLPHTDNPGLTHAMECM
jgi:hypothetical protein